MPESIIAQVAQTPQGVYRPPGQRTGVASEGSVYDGPANTYRKVPGTRPTNPIKKASAVNKRIPIIAPPKEPEAVVNPYDEKEKKIKVVQKKLRQIEGLRKRNDNGEKLELTQLSKLDTEDSVRKELEKLMIEMN